VERLASGGVGAVAEILHGASPPVPLAASRGEVVETPQQLADMLDYVEGVKAIGLDLEHARHQSYRGLTCLIQVSDGARDFVLDPLALWDDLAGDGPLARRLRGVLADPGVLKVLHGGNNDVQWLQRDFLVFLVNVLDTEKLAGGVGVQRRSLQALLARYYGVETDKAWQVADWTRRPLSPAAVEYARIDAHFLVGLAGKLLAEGAGATAEAPVEAAHLAGLLRGSRVEGAVVQSQRMAAAVYQKPEASAQLSSESARLLQKARECSQLHSKLGLGTSWVAPKKGARRGPVAHSRGGDALEDVVVALAAWRDGVARAVDEPGQAVLSDESVVALAMSPPPLWDRPRFVRTMLEFVDRHWWVFNVKRLNGKLQKVQGGESVASGIPAPPTRAARGPAARRAVIAGLESAAAAVLGGRTPYAPSDLVAECLSRVAGAFSPAPKPPAGPVPPAWSTRRTEVALARGLEREVARALREAKEGSGRLLALKRELAVGAAATGAGNAAKKRRKDDPEFMARMHLKFGAKKQVYENCRMLAMDGQLLCFTDRKKLEWYVHKGLAVRVQEDPPTIRLTFQHQTADQARGADAFYSASKANQCVGCGATRNYLRFRVIPSCYRRQFPVGLKSHRSHDVVLLCMACHEVAHKASEKLKRQLADEYGVPMGPSGGAGAGDGGDGVARGPAAGAPEVGGGRGSGSERPRGTDSEPGAEPGGSGEGGPRGSGRLAPYIVRRMTLALEEHRHKMPARRVEEIEDVIRGYLGREKGTPLTQADFGEAALAGLGRDKRRRELARQLGVRTSELPRHAAGGQAGREGGQWWHGKRLVERIVGEQGEAGLETLSVRFRECLVAALQPQHLPAAWSTEHLAAREYGERSVFHGGPPPEGPGGARTSRSELSELAEACRASSVWEALG